MSTSVGQDDLGHDDLQRFAEMGRLSASLIHEISNPLSIALIHLDQVGDQSSHSIKSLRRSLVRLARYVNAARGQLRSESSPACFYIDSQLKDVKRLVQPVARASFVRLRIKNSPHIKLFGDPLQFQQIFVNLIVNAIEAYPEVSRLSPERVVMVDIETRSKDILIHVRDNGDGIPKDLLNRVFEPFYTTKGNSGHGLGLGLVIVRRYVEDGFKGNIKVSSKQRQGTCFSVKLPLSTP